MEKPMASQALTLTATQPWGEDARLRALRRLLILDTPSEIAFDRITRLAAALAHTPISMLSFLDEHRLWAKSVLGTDITEVPREDSFCTHTIRGQGCFTIPDTLQDSRFASNPLVEKAGGIRFYAAAPVMAAGQPVGALCVVDTEPRKQFSFDDQQNLLSLAAIVSDQLELRLLRVHGALEGMESGATEERYAQASLATGDGFWDWDIESDIVYYSPRWQSILGFEKIERIDRLDHWIERIHPDDSARVAAELADHRMGRTPAFRSEHRMRHSDGTWRWVLTRGHSLQTSDEMATRMAGSMDDVTGDKTADPLTGLSNRLFFVDRLEQRLDRAAADGDWNFTVLFLNLNRFKMVNDTLGQCGGDALLIETAARLSPVEHRSSGKNVSLAARVNGANFLLLLDGVGAEAQAWKAATATAAKLSRSFSYEGNVLVPSASIGIVVASARYLHPEEILRDAETALSHAEAEGIDGCVAFTPEMRTQSTGRLRLESDLRRAIEEHELVLYYQPEVDLQSNEVIGFEALVRWQHPVRGLIAPGEFIPLAEETGLILALGDWVLPEACRQLVVWRNLCEKPLSLRISVNLSAQEFARPGLLQRVAAMLEQTGLEAENLRLEVTESSLMNGSETALFTMHALREMGVGLHMDDFGTGYSSLNYLHRFPFDTLKIDRSFVQCVCDHKESLEIVRTILDLANSLGMQVVAEGIETLPQLTALRDLGCRYGQGFYFARPLPAEAVRAMMPSLTNGRMDADSFKPLDTQPAAP